MQGREVIMPTVKDIIEHFLIRNKFDGLMDDDCECACIIDDFMPCEPNEGILNCRPGYRQPCDCEEQHSFHIAGKRKV